MKTSEKITAAKMKLMFDAPEFGGPLARFKIIPDPSVPTAYIDGIKIGYNPAWIDTLTVRQVEGLLAHEVLHVLLMHHIRRGKRDSATWNMAGDYVINLIVRQLSLELPSNGLINDEYHEKSTDYVYTDIYQEQPTPEGTPGKGNDSGDDSGDDDSDDNSGEGDSGGDDDDSGDSGDSGDDSGGDDDSDDDGSGATGSGGDNTTDNTTDNNELSNTGGDTGQDYNRPDPWGEVRDFPGESQAEIEQHESELKVLIAQSIMTAKAAGRDPGHYQRIAEIIEPAISLSQYLRQFVDRSCSVDYTFAMPSRRYTDFIMPSLKAESLANIIFAIDTSGSIGQRELNQYAAIITATLEEFHQEAIIIYCDSRVYEDNVEKYSRYDLPVTLKPVGGGGTAFKPVFDYVDREGLNPLCLVYFTDLEGDLDIPDPGYPVLWVQYSPGQSQVVKDYYARQIKFGELIQIDDIN